MSEACLIYPHQLFEQHPGLRAGRVVWLVEDELFFGQENLHPFKLGLHRGSMQAYAEELRLRGYHVELATWPELGKTEVLIRALWLSGIRQLHFADPADYLLERRLKRYAAACGMELMEHPSPGFLLSKSELKADLEQKKNWLMGNFYIQQRKRHGLLLEKCEKPLGGSWSYDAQNRKKLPKGLAPPAVWLPGTSAFPYALNRRDALKMLQDFCANRLDGFGAYQDALDPQHPFLFHALLSPAINIGLLSPSEVLSAVLERHREDPVPLPALEGFIRQIIGWREFMRGVYVMKGSEMRNSNFWGFEQEIPAAFWRGETGLPPVDDALRKVGKLAYAHHIERLMVLGNVLLLCECHPHAVYHWFMQNFIDAYDWVMVPNVYGMSQYADGGMITTKPYLSGSNYVRKQSHYAAGEWCADWDALFWRFIWLNQEVFRGNPRMRMMASLAGRMNAGTRNAHLHRAERVLERLRS